MQQAWSRRRGRYEAGRRDGRGENGLHGRFPCCSSCLARSMNRSNKPDPRPGAKDVPIQPPGADTSSTRLNARRCACACPNARSRRRCTMSIFLNMPTSSDIHAGPVRPIGRTLGCGQGRYRLALPADRLNGAQSFGAQQVLDERSGAGLDAVRGDQLVPMGVFGGNGEATGPRRRSRTKHGAGIRGEARH